MNELKNVYQKIGDPLRRWFKDDFFDLITWENENKELIGFQLCYDIQGNEKAISYIGGKYSHNKIDQGEDNPGKNLTPILVADGVFNKQAILSKFEDASSNLEQETRDYVISKIKGYGAI
jgi:hypothetical protein